VGPFTTELDSYRVLISTLCVLAPLAGLLGTVSGMIVTFDGLATGSMYSRGGGIAGGISEALYSTEMGLVVAVPGIVLGRLLDRKQRVLVDQLERLVAEGAP
jgi:biopolymer transport protein ExbB